MKAPQQILCFALAAMLSSTGWTRIGETEQECLDRYEDCVDVGWASEPLGISRVRTLRFRKSEFSISVEIWGEPAIVRRVTFSSTRPFTKDEVALLLERNGGESPWKSAPPSIEHLGKQFEQWECKSPLGELVATQQSDRALVIAQKEYLQLVADQQKASELQEKRLKAEQALQGF
jgi:hypothetical protein